MSKSKERRRIKYRTYGPFQMPRIDGLIEKEGLREFWEQTVDGKYPGLSGAVGCYVFVVGVKPWYVGRAERQPFRKECVQSHKLYIYNTVLHKVRSKPSLFLLAKLTTRDKYTKPTAGRHHSSRELESILIGQALTRNRKLQNIKDTKYLRFLVVPGVLNTPKGAARAKSVQELKKKLGTASD